MEAGQPSHRTCRKQHMSAIIKEGWSLLAQKQMVLPVDAFTAFGFASAPSKQTCLLWSSALLLQPGWWQWEVCGASTPAPRAGSPPLSMLPRETRLSLSLVWLPTLVWTFLMSMQALLVTNSYGAAKAVAWLSYLHRVLAILLCQRSCQRHRWAETNIKDGLQTCYKHSLAGTLSTSFFSQGIHVIYKSVARASSASHFPHCWHAAQPGLCSGSCKVALNSCCEAVPALLLPQRVFSARLANGWVSPIQSAEQCGDRFRFY